MLVRPADGSVERMSTVREQLIDIAMEPDNARRRLRSEIADATGTVSALEQEISRLTTRLALAKRHARQLGDEYALRYGAYP